MELIPVPLVHVALSLGEIRGSCVPGGSLGSLFTDGQGCDPTWIVVWPGASLMMVGVRYSQNAHLHERHAAEYSLELCLQCLPHNKPHSPIFPRCPPRTAVWLDPDSYGDFALPWDPVHMKVHVHLLRMGSPFPPVPWSSWAQSPLAFNARCSGGSFSQCQIRTCGSLMWGSELSLL